MDGPTIAPALSGEEWEQVRSEMIINGHAVFGWFVNRPAAQLAVANSRLPDDDPRKITRERIEEMRRAVGMLKADPPWSMSPIVGRLESFADALESYLPRKGPE